MTFTGHRGARLTYQLVRTVTCNVPVTAGQGKINPNIIILSMKKNEERGYLIITELFSECLSLADLHSKFIGSIPTAVHSSFTSSPASADTKSTWEHATVSTLIG